jgi:hypothetical protein
MEPVVFALYNKAQNKDESLNAVGAASFPFVVLAALEVHVLGDHLLHSVHVVSGTIF